jgi:hypothetical protein
MGDYMVYINILMAHERRSKTKRGICLPVREDLSNQIELWSEPCFTAVPPLPPQRPWWPGGKTCTVPGSPCWAGSDPVADAFWSLSFDSPASAVNSFRGNRCW